MYWSCWGCLLNADHAYAPVFDSARGLVFGIATLRDGCRSGTSCESSVHPPVQTVKQLTYTLFVGILHGLYHLAYTV